MRSHSQTIAFVTQYWQPQGDLPQCLEALVLLPQLEVSVHLAGLGENALNAVIKNLEDCT